MSPAGEKNPMITIIIPGEPVAQKRARFRQVKTKDGGSLFRPTIPR